MSTKIRERTVPVDRLRVTLLLAAHGLHLRRLGEEVGISHPGALRALRAGRLQPRLLALIAERTSIYAGYLTGAKQYSAARTTDSGFMRMLRDVTSGCKA